MSDGTRFPEVEVHDRAAPSRFAARARPEVVTSLGIGSLKRPVDPPSAERRSPGASPVAEPWADRPSAPDDELVAVHDGVSGPDAPASDDEPGRILSIENCGPTVRVFRIARPAGFTFKPGQYVKLGAPGGKREDFSLASAPHEPHLELAIELREGGQVTPALFALGPGDAVDISTGAKGKLVLDPTAHHHLMVATVTGIAPLLSMVRDALHRGTAGEFTVVVGASYQEELPFHRELAELAAGAPLLTYIPTISRPGEPANKTWSGSIGRADAVAIEVASRLDPSATHVYAVGNAGMIASVVGTLGSQGFPVSTESYGG